MNNPSTAHLSAVPDLPGTAVVRGAHPARAWARRERIPVLRSGRLSPELLEAWEAAGSPILTLPEGTAAARWERLLDDWTVSARASGRRESTIRLRRFIVDKFARDVAVDPADVDREAVTRWLANPDWSPETRKSYRSGVAVVFGWAHESGRLPTDPTHRLPGVRVPTGVPRPAPETVIRDAIHRADAARSQRGRADRDRLMILLGALAGLRAGEIAGIAVQDITEDGFRVTGKGGRQRLIPVHPSLVCELRTYLDAKGITEGYLFPGLDGGHLSVDAVTRRLSRLLGPGYTAHSLRHRFGTRAYAATFDIRACQELLGHASPATTARYIAAPAESLINAVNGVPAVPGIQAAS